MRFFLDNMMSPRLARALQVLFEIEHEICHIKTEGRFHGGTKDRDWISPLCADPDPWAIISGDISMLSNQTIIADLKKSNNTFFCMDEHWCSGNTDHSQTWKLFKAWPDIVAYASLEGPGFFEIRTGTNNPRVEELRHSRRARRLRLLPSPPVASTGILRPSAQSPPAVG